MAHVSIVTDHTPRNVPEAVQSYLVIPGGRPRHFPRHTLPILKRPSGGGGGGLLIEHSVCCRATVSFCT